MRNESRTSGSGRGGKKPVAERRHGAYRLLLHFKIVSASPAPMSGNQQRSELGKLRDAVTSVLRAVGFVVDPSDPTHHRSRDQNRYMVYDLPLNTEAGPGLRPSIQIELTHTKLRRPTVVLPVQSFFAEAFGRSPEIKNVECVSVTETAAEKLVALTRRIAMELAGVSRNPDPTLVRHIYDLHFIRSRIVPDEVAALARDIAATDAAEFKNQYPAYHADIRGETRKALTAIGSDPAFRQNYASFVQSMVYGERPEFDAAFATVAELTKIFLTEVGISHASR